MTLIETIQRIDALHHGGHAPASECACAAEAVNRGLGHGWGTSCPEEIHPAARPLWGLVVPFNDSIPGAAPEERAEFMRPLLLAIAECDGAPEGGWGFSLADIAVRRWAPLALDGAGLAEQAARLRALAPIVDRQTARAAMEAARAAMEAARAAASAGWAAMEAAAAARAAAEDRLSFIISRRDEVIAVIRGGAK